MGVGIALTAWTWAGHGAMCPLCLSVHAINLLLAHALWRASPRTFAARLETLRAAWTWLLSSWAGTSEPARWKLVGFSSVALLAIVAYQWVHAEGALRRPPPLDRAAILAAHHAAPRVVLTVDEDDPHLGPLDAPARLVLFESFRCSACRRLAGMVPRLRARFGDRLLVAVKQYPLSTVCNPRLTRDMQPGACELAWAAEAARRQSQFWRFRDALFAAGTNDSPETVAIVARRLGLDLARFETDRVSDSTKQRVALDIELGSRLGIPGTPAVFLNGRLVRSVSVEALEILIRSDLEQQVAAAAPGLQHGPAKE
jgi:protein-disulfide isomerase